MKWWLQGGRVVDPASGEDAVRDVFVDGDTIVAAPDDRDAFTPIDCEGLVVAPGFVDLHACMPDPATESAAAVAGGFTTVVLSPANPHPIERPAVVRDLLARAAEARCRIALAGALTAGLKGEEIADVGLLTRAGCAVLSNGATPVRNARVLRHLLEYAGRFDAPVFLRAADVDLEGNGIVREGPRAAWLGLPYVPPEAEEIGITTVAALVRRTGTPVHVTHVWSRRGVDALRDARDEGLPITGSTTAHHVALDDSVIDELAYAGACRFVPPLGDAEDRAALVQALADGVLVGVASDHRPVPLHLQDRELELAVPGQIAFQTALPLVLRALGSVPAAVAALATGPSRLIGRPATLTPGAPADLVVLDPDVTWVADAEALASATTNTPLLGRPLAGLVRLTMVAGRPVQEVTAR